MVATKKKNMVETPVDRRETFMSLKNRSDLDASTMEHKLHTLYLIQQKDSKKDEIHLLLGELPDEIRDLEDEIEGLKTRISKIEGEIVDCEKFISQKKLDTQSCNDLIAKYTEQQENVKNNREFVSISREIDYQKLELEYIAKKVGEKTSQIKELNETLDVTKEDLKQKEINLVEKKKESESIVEETAKEEEVLDKEIAELKSHLDARTLAAYEKVRANSRNGLAVVTVKRDACGGCFNKIPPQRQLDIAMNKKIIVCEYCGRILVSPDFEDDKEE